MPRNPDPFDENDALRLIMEGLKKQVYAPNMHRYVPHPKQLEFHEDQHKERLFVAGNRSGKSLSCVIEGIYYLTHTHPYRKTPDGPVRGRVVAVDFLNGIDKTILPLYKQWLPVEYLIDGLWEKSYSQERHTLTLNNGSFVEFMSQDQDLDKFSGTSRHFIHFDEECPRIIFDECLMRLIDTDGDWWISETPVAGMEWIYDDLYEPAKEGTRDIGLIEASMSDNIYLPASGRERLLSMFTAEERLMREKGQYTTVTGQLFRDYHDTPTHDGGNVVDDTMVKLEQHDRLYLTGDHGFNAPTAWLWVIAKPNKTLIVWKEWYKTQTTVEDHAAAIKRINAEIGRDPYLIFGDPAMNQKSGITGDSIVAEYARWGIQVQTKGITRDKLVGVNKVNQYLKQNPKTDLPFLLVAASCENTRREVKGAKAARIVNKLVASRKNAPEGMREKDDHTPDAIRYLVTAMPDGLSADDIAGTAPDINYDDVGLPYSRTWDGVDHRYTQMEAFGWRGSQTQGLEG